MVHKATEQAFLHLEASQGQSRFWPSCLRAPRLLYRQLAEKRKLDRLTEEPEHQNTLFWTGSGCVRVCMREHVGLWVTSCFCVYTLCVCVQECRFVYSSGVFCVNLRFNLRNDFMEFVEFRNKCSLELKNNLMHLTRMYLSNILQIPFICIKKNTSWPMVHLKMTQLCFLLCFYLNAMVKNTF